MYLRWSQGQILDTCSTKNQVTELMASKMALSAKIDAAKSQAEALRHAIQVEKVRIDNSKDFATSKDLRGIINQPRVRRILKGHFGKVYAMHWSGNGFVSHHLF